MRKNPVLSNTDFQSTIETAKSSEIDGNWILVSEGLPEEGTNPYTLDYYEYPCTIQMSDGERDVRYYKFGRGHFYHGSQIVDHLVIAWMERPLPYTGETKINE